MGHDRYAIPGDLGVHLQGGHPHLQRIGEGGQGAFRDEAEAATMRLEIEGPGLVEQVWWGIRLGCRLIVIAGREQQGRKEHQAKEARCWDRHENNLVE
ncbi:hypothetical protein D3C76_1403320 [compost metagenome]